MTEKDDFLTAPLPDPPPAGLPVERLGPNLLVAGQLGSTIALRFRATLRVLAR
jgi:hypothetical protein